ncbi:hypothetical protein T459_01330 [Capsicum annuum]|uniref:Uncharacterized protein n=1 Tax=Capsicum annuum TaxID=4072 RepID=A0A2G3AGY2_CAPAN|nr:hypothetical protein T459_01330 [Capsicum annuum]
MVDSGSTHSFIDAQTVKEIGFKPTFSPPIRKYNPVKFNHEKNCVTIGKKRAKAQALLAKRSKCSFGQSRVEYLGHVITMEEVSTDPDKVQAMIDWPTPKTLKALRGCLGLKRHYRKYVANYGLIYRPLTSLLKKDVL